MSPPKKAPPIPTVRKPRLIEKRHPRELSECVRWGLQKFNHSCRHKVLCDQVGCPGRFDCLECTCGFKPFSLDEQMQHLKEHVDDPLEESKHRPRVDCTGLLPNGDKCNVVHKCTTKHIIPGTCRFCSHRKYNAEVIIKVSSLDELSKLLAPGVLQQKRGGGGVFVMRDVILSGVQLREGTCLERLQGPLTEGLQEGEDRASVMKICHDLKDVRDLKDMIDDFAYNLVFVKDLLATTKGQVDVSENAEPGDVARAVAEVIRDTRDLHVDTIKSELNLPAATLMRRTQLLRVTDRFSAIAETNRTRVVKVTKRIGNTIEMVEDAVVDLKGCVYEHDFLNVMLAEFLWMSKQQARACFRLLKVPRSEHEMDDDRDFTTMVEWMQLIKKGLPG
mmetsp:Transcript_71838/g.191614  ORF Transcript_71838/g.191614 Transcript_71838/m.191614 type:complete len:390 (-) Transcript_71838:166-1335(-)